MSAIHSTVKTTVNSTVARRDFLQAMSALAAGAFAGGRRAFGKKGSQPNERITVGVVGLGSRGFNLIDDLLGQADAQIVAVCDVDALHYRDQPWGKGKAFGRQAAKTHIEKQYARKTKSGAFRGLQEYSDYRRICRRDDIDAVVVATPDHWHALCTLEALRSGKDVYCEKPVTHLFSEGQAVYREVANRKAVFQTGSQQRSNPLFRRAVELVRNGHIGQVQRVEVGLPPGYEKPQGDTTHLKIPPTLDYDFWCGPSEKLPYMRARHHRWWRGHRAFGGGVLMDWIGHHNDIAHWALDVDQSGPTQVKAIGWTFPESNVYNTPHHYEMRCTFKGGVTTSISDKHPIGSKFIGENGRWIHVRRGRLQASDARWTQPDFDPGDIKVYVSPGHMRNFLDGVRSRKSCVAPAETAHRSITPGHLGYVSQAVGRALQWDAAQEQIIGDEEANTLLHAVSYREPWRLS